MIIQQWFKFPKAIVPLSTKSAMAPSTYKEEDCTIHLKYLPKSSTQRRLTVHVTANQQSMSSQFCVNQQAELFMLNLCLPYYQIAMIVLHSQTLQDL